ncbi:MAG: hypothetical protein QM487_11625 [Candidatus Marithrix sp.]
MAKNLRTRFAEMDGILVLADAPYSGQLGHAESSQKSRDGQNHMDLYQLRQALSLLHGEQEAALDTPVALLVNKWDRYSNIDHNNPIAEQDKLENFLNSIPQPPHKVLYNELSSSITAGNFKAFPVSSLGMNEFIRLDNGDIVERFKQVNPLKSFGLLDAFVWIAKQRDAIDLQHYQTNATKNLKQYRQQGLELLRRFPVNSEQAKQVETVFKQCRKLEIYRWTVAIIAVPILCFIVETVVDTTDYHKHTVAIDTPHVTHAQLEKAEQWFAKYTTASVFRHFISKKLVLDQDKAQIILTNLQKDRETFLWIPVEAALKDNLTAAGVAASEYLQHYQYDTHAEEAQSIWLRAELKKQQQENEDAFRNIAGQIRENSQDIEKFVELLETLRSLPKHPQIETDEMRKERIALEQQVSNKLVQIASQQEWDKFQRSYDSNMRLGNFLTAAKSLANRQEDTDLKALKANFKTVVVGGLEKRATQAVKDERLQAAKEILEQYAKFPDELKTVEGKSKITQWQLSVAEREDEALYVQVKEYRDMDHVRAYMQHAPLQSMITTVKAYQNYLDKIDPKTTLKLQLQLVRITWTDEAKEDNNNVVTVYLNGNKIIKKPDIDSSNSTGIVGTSDRFSFKPSERIKIEMTVLEKDIIFDDDNGQGKIRKSVSELANDYDLKLRRKDDGVETGTAYFKVLGYPKAPDLPIWHGIR